MDVVVKPDAYAPAQQFESAYFARKLFPLVERLATEYPGEWKWQVKDVGLLFKQLTVFLETAFGRNSSERRFPKLPAQLLRDSSLNGSVHFVLKTYHSFLQERSLKRIDFASSDEMPQKMEFLGYLREAVVKAGWVKFPVVHIDASTGGRREELEAIVRSLGGSVSDSSEDPAVTHIVYPFGPEGDPDDGIQYLRSLEMRPGEYFVHYWYFPDSYDNWMPADVAPESLEPDRKPIGPWKVYLRWLVDSQKFNEWMNPIDYETEEFQDEQEALQDQAEDTKTVEEEEDEEEEDGMNSDEDVDSVTTDEKTLQKRKSDALSDFLLAGPSKKQDTSTDLPDNVRRLRSDSHRPEVNESEAIKIGPNITKHSPLEISNDAFSGAVENISHCVESSVAPKEQESEEEDETACYKHLYTVPAHASWFDWESVHSIEVEGVPLKSEETSDGVDRETYRRWRNVMIDKFRERPHRRLTMSDLRKKLPGEMEALKKVFDFLTKWGLINYMPASTPYSLKQSTGDADDGICVSVPSSAPPLIHFSNSVTLPEMNAAMTHGNEKAFSLLNRTNKYGKTVTDSSSVMGGIRCSAMPWIDCTESYYHCITLPDIDLCPQAFMEGRFPSGTSAKDYIKISNGGQSAKTDGSGWTDQETLLLLEAIEMYRDDWAEVAEHVATKSQLQCAMHWLTMSIEDDFVHEMFSNEGTSFQARDEDFMKSLPFADARNPVMAQIAFLAAVVSPEVAGTAAQEAMQYLSAEDLDPEKFPNGDVPGHQSERDQGAGGAMTTEKMRRAAVAALKSATVKAKLLSEQQEREIQRLMNIVITAQIKKIEIKLKYCSEQDKALDDERGRLEAARLQIHTDRFQLRPSVTPQSASDARPVTSLPPATTNGATNGRN